MRPDRLIFGIVVGSWPKIPRSAVNFWVILPFAIQNREQSGNKLITQIFHTSGLFEPSGLDNPESATPTIFSFFLHTHHIQKKSLLFPETVLLPTNHPRQPCQRVNQISFLLIPFPQFPASLSTLFSYIGLDNIELMLPLDSS